MFCPNCGQQQVSEQMRFCSRCGFPLGLVSEILSHGGFLPQLTEINENKSRFTRRKVFRFGLIWFLIFIFIIIPATAALLGDTSIGERVFPFVAIIGSMGGIFLMLLSLFFESSKKSNEKFISQPQNFINSHQIASPTMQGLPPQSANFTPPVTAYAPPRSSWRDAKTGELVPPSITEGTTRLLEKDEL